MWSLFLWLWITSHYWNNQVQTDILKSSGLPGCVRLQGYVLIQAPDQAFHDFTKHHSWPLVLTFSFFFQTASEPHPMSLTGGERWNKSRRGACPAEVQAWGVNRCVGSLPFRNGSRTRCTAAGCGAILLPLPHVLCVATLNPVKKQWRPGWGYGVNLICRCSTFREGG